MSANHRQYLLLDGAQIDDLLLQLYQLEDSPAVQRLYQGTRYAALADAGPILVQLAQGSRLEQYFVEHWQARAGLWLETDASEAELIEHLRSLIHASVQGVTVLLRYYDPRIMRHWLLELPADERDRLMGPVSCIRLPATEAGSEVVELQRQMPSPAAHHDNTPWLHLDDEQVERLNRAQLEAFDQRLLAHIDQHFPDCLAGYDRNTCLAWAAACRRSAGAYGYSAADQVVQWANLCAVLGTDFPQGQSHQAYRQILDTPQLRPEQRLERLSLELQRQLLTDMEANA